MSLEINHAIELLPVELLLHIFKMCDPDIKARFRLTHICQRWRIISMECPALWTYVVIFTSQDHSGDIFNKFMALLEVQLSQTADLPLDVYWGGSANENRHCRVMHLIRKKAPFSRWRTLSMRVNDYYPHGVLAPLPTDTFTNLESLTIAKPMNYSLVDTISRTATSKLQVLDLRSSSATPEAVSSTYGIIMTKISRLILPSFHTADTNVNIPPNISHLEADTRHKHLFPYITHYKLTVCVLNMTQTLLPNLTHLTVTSTLDVQSGSEVMLQSLKTLRCAAIRLGSNSTLIAPVLEKLHFCASYSSAVNSIRVGAIERTLQDPGYQLSSKLLLNIELCMRKKSILTALRLSPHVSEVSLTFDNDTSARCIMENAFATVSTEGETAASMGPQVQKLRLEFKWPIQDLDFWKARASFWVAERQSSGVPLLIYASWKGEGTDVLLA